MDKRKIMTTKRLHHLKNIGYKKGRKGLKGQKAWNKGLTKETDERIMQHSKLMAGRKLSKNHCENISKAKRISSGGGWSWYHKHARKMMEQYLGRKLTSKETIHHLDHNWKNFEIDNLYIFPNRATHQVYHHFLKRCVIDCLKERIIQLKMEELL